MTRLKSNSKCNKCSHLLQGMCLVGKNPEYADNDCWMFNDKVNKEIVAPSSPGDPTANY